VIETESGTVVYVVDSQGKVAVQRVDAAQSYQGLRVIAKGLGSGVPVIVERLQSIRPGITVKTELAVFPRGAALETKISSAFTYGKEPASKTIAHKS
jgi:membrane fusion protein, multidrug efflux system